MRPNISPELRGALLSDLGQRVLGAIAATQTLGHARLKHTSAYVHVAGNPSVDLIRAVVDGDIERVDEALRAWETTGPEWACKEYGLDPAEHIFGPAPEPGDVSLTAIELMGRLSAELSWP